MQRYVFVDWMKVIGIYLIVCGHFLQPCPPFISYIYVFSVPVFFVISGFLFKKETDGRLFWKKIWNSLLLPMLGICFFTLCYDSVICMVRHKDFVLMDIPVRLLNIIVGIHSDERGNGLQVCWFIYTLVVLKVLMQYMPQRILLLFVMPLSLTAVIIVSMHGANFICKNAIVISSLCLPFFMLGRFARLVDFPQMINCKRKLWLLGIFSLFMTILIGYYNGPAWVYQCQYGRDFTLFIMGGVNGTLLMFTVSYMLSRFNNRLLETLSSGTVIILGFHQISFHIVYNLPYIHQYPLLYYIAGVFIVLSFYPVIVCISRWFPFLLGGRKIA